MAKVGKEEAAGSTPVRFGAQTTPVLALQFYNLISMIVVLERYLAQNCFISTTNFYYFTTELASF